MNHATRHTESPAGTGDSGQPVDLKALYAVFDESRALFHRLTAVAERIHKLGERSGGRRGILESLSRHGPQTVPQMARARPVSRQHIQVLVNDLISAGHVQVIDNPQHRRSRLVRLTPEGKSVLDQMYHREAQALQAVTFDNLSEEDLLRAAAVLKTVREYFEGAPWQARQEAPR